MTLLLLVLGGFAAWALSTVAAGGGAILLIPFVSFLVGAQAVAPVVTLTSLIGGPARIYVFWRDVDWRIVRWYLPGAIPGAFLGGWAFSQVQVGWLQVILGFFLISTVWQYRFGERERSFRMKLPWFLLLGFGVAFVSGLVGATGEVLNPFYLNYGATKAGIVATKTVNSFIMHATKIGTYTLFGALGGQDLLYGVAAGIGAIAASWVGKRWLERLSSKRFRQLAIAVMTASGLGLLWDQRALLVEAWDWLTR